MTYKYKEITIHRPYRTDRKLICCELAVFFVNGREILLNGREILLNGREILLDGREILLDGRELRLA
ncbi:MAG: hypothetical protein IKA74_04195 [Clostridia bacterium]|nr:hypothetical protein [Clostridia bacterium]